MVRCAPLPNPIPPCRICCAKGEANSASAPAATTPGRIRCARRNSCRAPCSMVCRRDLPSTAARSWPRTISHGRWAWAAASANSDRWEATSPRPSPVPRRVSAMRAIRCALSIRKILSARAPHSASPAIATPPAAITILPKPAPWKARRGRWTTGADGKRSRCHKALAIWGVWRFPPGRRNTGTGRAGMRRYISGSTAPGKGSPGGWAITTPAPAVSKKMIAPGLSISIFRWVVRCPTAR